MSAADTITPGISKALAEQRVQAIADIRYTLSFNLPSSLSEPVTGKVEIRFTCKKPKQPLILDFRPGRESLIYVSCRFTAENGHIVIPAEELLPGENAIRIEFRAGEGSIKRHADFVYTLFVPARAHYAFPCFDQPDLKARFTLSLNIPKGWQCVGNGAEVVRETEADRQRVRFADTLPISTYLFAFAAGAFSMDTATRDGRILRMFHRETDTARLQRNRDAIFDLHAKSLDWLEEYTSIPYAFGKFDFVLIPSFPFSGMEHPGCIFYNAAALLPGVAATENHLLRRASLIAHETAHMWFGDLVTMRWFDDVWLKEVFANFIAAKVVHPSFTSVDHGLQFLIAHYPGAYAVDRSAGAHPVRQDLPNLDEAGTLYGPIIYQKAPVVMLQIERAVGPERLREGLREYLRVFKFGNAEWRDLMRVLPEADWSVPWIEETGRPTLRSELELTEHAEIQRLEIVQTGVSRRQHIDVLIGTEDSLHSLPGEVEKERTAIADSASITGVQFVLPLAYGDVVLDNTSRSFLLEHLSTLPGGFIRGAAWITLWEEVLQNRIRPLDFAASIMRSLPAEDIDQNVQLVLTYVRDLFWRLLSEPERRQVAPDLEETLRAGFEKAPTVSMRASYFSAFVSVATTSAAIEFIAKIWRRRETLSELVLGEDDETFLAFELAVRSRAQSSAVLAEQRDRITNPDRKARFEFVMPALSGSETERDRFFDSLSKIENRRREPWVLEAVRYLNHPLRSGTSLKYLRPSLDLLEEIQRTGDIFFPRNWMDATLAGHNTPAAAETVRAFLKERPEYPAYLRRIVLQSADMLFRAASLIS